MATPPEWIDTIPGAEAWSLYVVLAMCCSLPGVVTDCLGNRRTMLAGKVDATAAARPLARVWNSIFNCCEGALLQELDSMLTWAGLPSAQGSARTDCHLLPSTGVRMELPTPLPKWLLAATGLLHTLDGYTTRLSPRIAMVRPLLV